MNVANEGFVWFHLYCYTELNSQQLIACMFMQVIEAQVEMPTVGVVTLYSSLLKFTLHVHPDRLDYADQVLVCSYG